MTEKQSVLDPKSKKFWSAASEKTKKHRYVNFIDGQPIVVEIKNWNILMYDTAWGKKPAITCESGKILKVESIRLKWELEPFATKHVDLEITRFDSQPNPLNTYYQVKLLQEY